MVWSAQVRGFCLPQQDPSLPRSLCISLDLCFELALLQSRWCLSLLLSSYHKYVCVRVCAQVMLLKPAMVITVINRRYENEANYGDDVIPTLREGAGGHHDLRPERKRQWEWKKRTKEEVVKIKGGLNEPGTSLLINPTKLHDIHLLPLDGSLVTITSSIVLPHLFRINLPPKSLGRYGNNVERGQGKHHIHTFPVKM